MQVDCDATIPIRFRRKPCSRLKGGLGCEPRSSPWDSSPSPRQVPRPSPLSYSTSGQIDPTNGVKGTNVISYVPLSNSNSVDMSSGKTNVGLGNFVISPLAANTSTSYDNTPFKISFLPASYNNDTTVSKDAPVVLTGFLNGVVNGMSSSTVQASFNPVPNGMVGLGSRNGQFLAADRSLLLAPSTSNSGTTSAQGLVTFTPGNGNGGGGGEAPVPEPSTIALF